MIEFHCKNEKVCNRGSGVFNELREWVGYWLSSCAPMFLMATPAFGSQRKKKLWFVPLLISRWNEKTFGFQVTWIGTLLIMIFKWKEQEELFKVEDFKYWTKINPVRLEAFWSWLEPIRWPGLLVYRWSNLPSKLYRKDFFISWGFSTCFLHRNNLWNSQDMKVLEHHTALLNLLS